MKKLCWGAPAVTERKAEVQCSPVRELNRDGRDRKYPADQISKRKLPDDKICRISRHRNRSAWLDNRPKDDKVKAIRST
ncbi:hypothetical protein TSAR_000453 [Trichomalopsis sarcophagae]|uniref:Uncharacterized protein n=1 Tax=Trichomalopsis sarcophagae TaxID=543379 RepID=A0A232F5X6_9HYME|nr:hypothetical protein TSAR_000453 [Trichomalopsis sarcophagae]